MADVAQSSTTDYLCVDRFMSDISSARALQTAMELGLIDSLLRQRTANVRAIAAQAELDWDAAPLLLGMLRANGVVEEDAGNVLLTAEFLNALRYRDLIEAKLEFAALVAPDFLQRFTTLLVDPAAFFDQASLFDLFSYDRCFDPTPENLAATRRWMRFTTALTRYEASSCIERHQFATSRRLLDVGGNSGEFALQLCKVLPDLTATVLDLPVVCELGKEHVAGEAEASRIYFVKSNGSNQGFPTGFDTVCFKSMLHDWPDEQMVGFLQNAYEALETGGTLLIFERGKVVVGPTPIPYSLIPIMLFFRAYRVPQEYEREMIRIGFRDIRVEMIQLDMPFMLIRARK